MTRLVGLDVSQKITAICVVDDIGRRLWRGQCPTIPVQISILVSRYAGDDDRLGIETGAMTRWLGARTQQSRACNHLPRREARTRRPRDADKQDRSKRCGGIGSDRSHGVVPVCPRQIVREPPRACPSRCKDSTHRYDDPVVQLHPGRTQDVWPAAGRDARIAVALREGDFVQEPISAANIGDILRPLREKNVPHKTMSSRHTAVRWTSPRSRALLGVTRRGAEACSAPPGPRRSLYQSIKAA